MPNVEATAASTAMQAQKEIGHSIRTSAQATRSLAMLRT